MQWCLSIAGLMLKLRKRWSGLMYKIEKNDDYLMVRFSEDFDANTIRAVIHNETMMKEFSYTNDIWMIGKCHAQIRLGELETMVRDFHCQCPRESTRTKTAVVAERGLTQAILELWVNAVRKKVPFEIKLFHNLKEAKDWLEVSKSLVA
jgi:hypothetical protein